MKITIEQIKEAQALGYKPVIIINGEYYELEEKDGEKECV